MKLLRRIAPALLILALLLSIVPFTSAFDVEGRWLHIRVEEESGDSDVRLNIPLSFVKSILPMIETNEFRGGSLYIDDADLEGIQLAEIVKAIHEAPDADFLTVRGDNENVTISKENGYLLVRADEGTDRVRVQVPLQIVDALFDPAQPNRLNLAAAIDALAAHTGGDLITVDSDDSMVRIWIDSDQTGGGR